MASTYRKRKVPEATRRAVAQRYGCLPGQTLTGVQCHWCPATGEIVWHRRMDGRPSKWVQFPGLELDHLHPESLGGTSDPENIVLSCRPCNRRRGARHPHVILTEEGLPNSRDPHCGKGREGKGSRKGRTSPSIPNSPSAQPEPRRWMPADAAIGGGR